METRRDRLVLSCCRNLFHLATQTRYTGNKHFLLSDTLHLRLQCMSSVWEETTKWLLFFPHTKFRKRQQPSTFSQWSAVTAADLRVWQKSVVLWMKHKCRKCGHWLKALLQVGLCNEYFSSPTANKSLTFWSEERVQFCLWKHKSMNVPVEHKGLQFVPGVIVDAKDVNLCNSPAELFKHVWLVIYSEENWRLNWT